MAIHPLQQVLDRCEHFKAESDRDYFDGVMYAGEALLKLVTLAFVACMNEDSQRTRYSILHKLVRSDGVGAWADQLTDVVQGTPSALLLGDAHQLQKELVTRSGSDSATYAHVHAMRDALRLVNDTVGPAEAKVQLLSLFRDFAAIRNATRGHGAYDSARLRQVAVLMAPAIDWLAGGLAILNLSWVHLHQNLSGKYRVTKLGSDDLSFSDLRQRAPTHKLQNGLYVWIGSPRFVELAEYELERGFLYLPNGGFNGKRYELICYSTGDKDLRDAAGYLVPPGELPESDTAALKDLRVMGECLTNAPVAAPDYVARPNLEDELSKCLLDERHPIVTLQGRGGIGKTSATLKVIEGFGSGDRFGQICWFSARDIDLLPEGPKKVKADAVTIDGFAETYCRTFTGKPRKSKDAKEELQRALGSKSGDPTLFIFDNFETVSFPLEVYEWIDTYIRLPNKALITTRIREFKGDWPVEVQGMDYEEAKNLVSSIVASLGLDRSPSDEEFNQLFDESGGHPYVIRVMLGDFSSYGKIRRVTAVASTNDGLLNALFERTYAQLSAGGARIFLTCAGWNSTIPVAVLEAVVSTAETDVRLDVMRAVDELRMSSLIEIRRSPGDGHDFIYVPLITQNFGKAKMMLSYHRSAVEADLKILHGFGAVSDGEHIRLKERVDRFVRHMAAAPARSGDLKTRGRIVLEILASHIPEIWLTISRLELEGAQDPGSESSLSSAREAIGRFLERMRDATDAGVDSRRVGEAWLEYFRISDNLKDDAGKINSLLGVARSRAVELSELSRLASEYNRLLASQSLQLDQATKNSVTEELAASLSEAMKKDVPSAADHSRLAWLYLRLNKEREALLEAEKGLKIDQDDEHCARIREKLAKQVV